MREICFQTRTLCLPVWTGWWEGKKYNDFWPVPFFCVVNTINSIDEWGGESLTVVCDVAFNGSENHPTFWGRTLFNQGHPKGRREWRVNYFLKENWPAHIFRRRTSSLGVILELNWPGRIISPTPFLLGTQWANLLYSVFMNAPSNLQIRGTFGFCDIISAVIKHS